MSKRDASGKFTGAPKEPLKRPEGFNMQDLRDAAGWEFANAQIFYMDKYDGAQPVHSIRKIHQSDGATVILLTNSHLK